MYRPVIFVLSTTVLLSTVFSDVASEKRMVSSLVATSSRLNCGLGGPLTTSQCRARGCVFSPVDEEGAPFCYFPPDYGYKVEELVRGEKGVVVKIRRNEAYANFTVFGDDFDELVVTVDEESDYRVRVKIEVVGVERFEVPLEVFPCEAGPSQTLYQVEISENPVFSIQIRRKSSGQIIFDTSLGGLTFSDQFIQVASFLPSQDVFGIGENQQSAFNHNLSTWKTWPLYARDQPPMWEGVYDFNGYGVQPRYTVLEEDGSAHGVMFVNSAAQEFETTPAPGMVYRTIGGIVDMYVFLGPGPEDVVSQFTEAVGRQEIPPYWSLGYHLCRYNYNSLDNMAAALDRTRNSGIPIDAQWGDIDIMDRRLDFTVDPINFAGLNQFVLDIKKEGVKFVTILDPGLSMGEPEGTYPSFESGQNLSVWVNRPDGSPFKAQVWPDDPVHFVDFSNPVAATWWRNEILKFHDILAYDALWIDMNEPSNFVLGDLDQGCAENKYNNPPYHTAAYGHWLADRTVCGDAEQHGGLHYHLHNLYGWFQAKPTLEGVRQAVGGRGMVLSRSTFLGSGRWAAHWLGDNWSLWSNLHYSIIGMLQFNQFGMPLVGADICGFNLPATKEMCIRWHQLGAFYPFSRNHNAKDWPDQDPAMFGEDAVSIMRDVLNLRYLLLPYLYTLFYLHHQLGHTVARPLWHEFPTEPPTRDIDTQFLLGRDLLVCPVITAGATGRSCYFPSARWYSGQSLVTHPGVEIHHREEDVYVDLPLDKVGVYFRGGSIIPVQTPGPNTQHSRSNPFQLHVFLDEQAAAQGKLFFDDGESVDTVTNKNFFLGEFSFRKLGLEYTVVEDSYRGMDTLKLSDIWVEGLRGPVAGVTIDGVEVETHQDGDLNLHVLNLQKEINKPFKMVVIMYPGNWNFQGA